MPARRPIVRVLRALLRAVAALLGLVLVLALVALVTLHTDWGRDQLRGRLETALDDAVRGEVRIGHVEGSVLGELVLHDVVVDNAQGQPVIAIDRLEIELALAALLGSELRFRALTADGVRVHLRRSDEGELEVAALVAPGDQPSSWAVVIEQLRVRDAAVAITGPGEDVHLDGVEVRGELAVPVDGPVRARAQADATWRERGVPVQVSAAVRAGDQGLEISDLDAGLAGVRLRAPRLRVAGDTISGALAIDAPAAAIARLRPASPLIADLQLRLRAAATPDGRGTRLGIDGALGPTAFRGVVGVVPAAHRATGAIVATRIDLARLLRDGAPTALDATLSFRLALDAGEVDVAALGGQLFATAVGRVEGVPVRRGYLAAQLDDRRVELRARAGGPGGLVASARGALVVGADAVVADDLAVEARVDELAALGLTDPPVRGAARADLVVTGRLAPEPALAVDGELRGRALRRDALRIGTLVASVHGRQLPGAPAGTVHLEARDVTHDGEDLGRLVIDARSRRDGAIAVAVTSRATAGPWQLDLDATVRIGDELVRVALGEYRLQTRGVDWAGRGGVLRIGARRVELDDLTTRVAGGRLAASGQYRFAGARAGDLRGRLVTRDLDLGEIDRSFGLPQTWRGRLDASVDLRRRGRVWDGHVEADGIGLVLRDGAAPVDVSADGRLGPRTASLDLEVRSPRVGTAMVAIEADPPRTYQDASAWQRLDRAAIRRGRVSLRRVDLGALAAVVGVEPPVRGRLDGELTLTRTDTRGWLRARDLIAAPLPAPVDLDLKLARAGGPVLAAEALIALRGLARIEATARVEVPSRPFDLAAWAGLDADAVRGATLRIPDLELDAARARRLGLPGGWSGRAAVTAEVADRLRSAVVDVDVGDLRGEAIATAIDGHLRLRVDGERTVAQGWAVTAGTTVLATVMTPLVLEEAWRGGLAALRRAPIEGRVDLECTPVRRLLAVVGHRRELVGTIEGDVLLDGTLGAPTATAGVVLRGLGIRTARVRELRATAQWDGTVLRAEVDAEQLDGGRLALDARIDPEQRTSARATLIARGLELAPFAQLGPTRFAGVAGVLDADLEIAGPAASARVRGELRVADAQFPLAARIGTLHQGTAHVALRDGRATLRLDGKIGHGSVRARGSATMQGLIPERAELEVAVRDVVMLAELQPEIDARLHAIVRRTDAGFWRMKATIDGGLVEIADLDPAPLYEQGVPPDMVIIEDGKPPPATVDPGAAWRAQLGTEPTAPWLRGEIVIEPVTVETEDARGRVSGALDVAIGDDGILLEGAISVDEGSIVLFDRRYRIERAELRLAGGDDATIDVSLVHEFPELTLHVGLSGPLRAPELELTSQPATYAEGQLLAFLLGGNPGEAQAPTLRERATGIASSLLSQKIAGYMDRFLPVELDVLRFEAATATTAATLTIGKWVTRKLFLAYERRLSARPDQNISEAEVEYWLESDVLLEAQVGDRGHHELDLLWIERW